MKLAALLREIERSSGPVTGIELAGRMGLSTSQVAAMVDALRAAGRIGPEIRDQQLMGSCSSAGACSMTCPGPDECSLTIDISVGGLEIRPLPR
jgi:predicted transcriptional regulator